MFNLNMRSTIRFPHQNHSHISRHVSCTGYRGHPPMDLCLLVYTVTGKVMLNSAICEFSWEWGLSRCLPPRRCGTRHWHSCCNLIFNGSSWITNMQWQQSNSRSARRWSTVKAAVSSDTTFVSAVDETSKAKGFWWRHQEGATNKLCKQ